MSIRYCIHKQLKKIGWDVRRSSTLEAERKRGDTSNQQRKWRILQIYRPEVILDIGANTGQFAKLARQICPNAKIMSFEPLKECFRQLQNSGDRLAPFEAFHMALGDEDGAKTMFRNAFTPSSSLLPMETLHTELLPHTSEVSEEQITVRRLDGIAASLDLLKPFVVKIDVQGYEKQAIEGGKSTLAMAEAIIVEISAYPLYRGEASFDVIYQLLRGMGFVYRGNVDQWLSPHDSRIMQFDCLFENDARQSNGLESSTNADT